MSLGSFTLCDTRKTAHARTVPARCNRLCQSHSRTPALEQDLHKQSTHTSYTEKGPAKPGDGLLTKRKGADVFQFSQFELLPRNYRFPVTDNCDTNTNCDALG